MARKNQPSKRNALDFVHAGTKRGEVIGWSDLPPDYVTELRDNPEGFEKGPIEVGRILPGERARLRLSGFPFVFDIRVVHDEHGNPHVVDLRMYSPPSLGDVAITNADLKAVSVAALAAAATAPPIPGAQFVHEDEPVAQVARGRGRPKRLTDDFLREVTRLAREAHRNDHPINGYIAAGLEQTVGYLADEETVRGWRKAATARRRQFPHDDSFLRSGELRGKPNTTKEH